MNPSRERILIVDDDRTFCRVLSAALRRRDYEVITAHDVHEGLSEAKAWSPHKAIIDLRMPGGGGLELVSALAKQNPLISMIVLTGYGSIATAVDAIKRGAIHYLTKPVGADELLSAFDADHENPASNEVDTSEAATLDIVEWEHLQRVLVDCEGNISEAARRLNMHRRTLQRKLARGRGA